jgi:hypothetical protein
MKYRKRTIICGNPDCEAELRVAKENESNGRLHQAYCPHCNYTSIPSMKN